MQEIEAERAKKHSEATLKMVADEDPMSTTEHDVESMITLMQEMRNMQMQSKDMVDNGMSDEDRRKRASEMILKIAAMMDLGDEDDGEGDDPDGAEWERLKNGTGGTADQ